MTAKQERQERLAAGRRRRHAMRMPARFEPLATYNAERSRGIMHTREWRMQMFELQAEFDQWAITKGGAG